MIAPFIYTLLGLATSTIYCPVRRKISPCTCEISANLPYITCEKLDAFATSVTALKGNIPTTDNVTLAISYSRLADINKYSFAELDLRIRKLLLNNDNISSLAGGPFRGLHGTQLLSLADNRLTEVPTAVLAELTNLKTLDLGKNKIETVPSHAFQSTPRLQYLVLPENKISSLGKNALPPQLKHVSLAKNQLQELNDNLKPMAALQWAIINNNQLPSLDGQLPGSSIKYLEVSYNQLRRLPAELLHFRQLDTLNLQHNLLHALDSRLKNCGSLQRLHVSHNHLEELSADEFEGATKLTDLRLDNNKLTRLNGALRALQGVTSVNLTGNWLQTFALQEIAGLQKLRQLLLASNHIRAISGISEKETLHQLQEVDLSSNALTSLDGALNHLAALKTLRLDHNGLEMISSQDFQGLASLRELDLSHNRLTSVKDTFQPRLGNLSWIYLQHNQLTELRGELRHLPAICRVNLSNNKITDLGRHVAGDSVCGFVSIILTDNPLSCSDHLARVVSEITASETKLVGLPSCLSPNQTAGTAT